MNTITPAALKQLRSLPNGATQWIQVTQLAEFLKDEEEFAGIDNYAVIAKFFSFLVYYQTPDAHEGLCVIAGVPVECEPYQNMYLARVPVEEI